MAEIEVHHGHPDANDPWGRRVGVMVGVLGILLAVVTISSHRSHTAAVVERTEANDEWAYYQAKKIREHTDEVASTLAEALGTDPAKTAAAKARFDTQAAKYVKDAEEIKAKAEEKMHHTEASEHRALAFDLAEGFLELGLVLTSLYFLGRDRWFPLGGGLAALIGIALGLVGLAGGETAARLAALFAG